MPISCSDKLYSTPTSSKNQKNKSKLDNNIVPIQKFVYLSLNPSSIFKLIQITSFKCQLSEIQLTSNFYLFPLSTYQKGSRYNHQSSGQKIQLIFNYFMQENKHKQAQCLRRCNRDILFQNNRAYNARMSQEAENQIDQNLEPRDEQMELRQQYKTIITTFSTYKYELNQLVSLIKQLNLSMMANYKSIIGIHSLGDNQEEIMTNKYWQKLIPCLVDNSHPYLQLKTAKIILRLMEQVHHINFPIYFNTETITNLTLRVLLCHENDILNQVGLLMLIKLLQNNYHIQQSDQQPSFLNILESLADKLAGNLGKLVTLFITLEQFMIYFSMERPQFNEKVLDIFIRLMHNQRCRQSPIITKIIDWSQEDGNLHKICLALGHLQSEQPQKLIRLIYTITNIGLDGTSLKLSAWKRFIRNFASTKLGFKILANMGIQRKIINQMYHCQELSLKLVLLETFQIILEAQMRYHQKQEIERLFDHNITFQHLQSLYQSQPDKDILKTLNSVLMTTIRAFPFHKRVQAIRSYHLISEFISNSINHDHITMKATFKSLKETLQHLQYLQKRELAYTYAYEELVELIITNENLPRVIRSLLLMSHQQCIEEIYTYFQSL